ncbi:hypothetical protein KPH14_009497 [Odynerus spinipes]|uniref:Uncharacterized protein n=1 Tax=Odynerus spinipes TaxID=1348599 RepID=A0AAD9RPJ6_9HYME|nr:hypothetical protein KPH14_009497 [Odynerus spinipes]
MFILEPIAGSYDSVNFHFPPVNEESPSIAQKWNDFSVHARTKSGDSYEAVNFHFPPVNEESLSVVSHDEEEEEEEEEEEKKKKKKVGGGGGAREEDGEFQGRVPVPRAIRTKAMAGATPAHTHTRTNIRTEGTAATGTVHKTKR